jgi:hypothetical protein
MTSIRISDVGTGVLYTLDGSTLVMVEDGGCRDALTLNHCQIDEGMSPEIIRRRVYDAWIRGYEGDPAANGLAVRVDQD